MPNQLAHFAIHADDLERAWACSGGSLPRLPKTTDARLLAAISHMQLCAEASGSGRWILREPGRQLLAYLGSSAEVDLSGESGSFRANVVDPRTGAAVAGGTVKAGQKVKFPTATVVWLQRAHHGERRALGGLAGADLRGPEFRRPGGGELAAGGRPAFCVLF